MTQLTKVKMPSISFVVARSYPGNIIGCNNELPWKLKSDLRRFKRITEGHAVIMGRKTYESIGKPLPNRDNIIISRKDRLSNHENSYWVKDKETAILLADLFSITRGKSEFFVIGGSEIFSMFEDQLFNKVHLTIVCSGDKIKGDSFFEYNFDKRVWRTLEELEVPASDVDEYPSRYVIYENRERKDRYRRSTEFLTDGEAVARFVENYKAQHESTNSKNVASISQETFPQLRYAD